MSAGAISKLPHTETQWEDKSKSNGVVSIHEIKARDSGSKITFHQYLALKTIWKEYSLNILSQDSWAQRFQSTKKEILEVSTNMKEDSHWNAYLKALDTTPRPKPSTCHPQLGCFATVLQNQLEVGILKEAKRDLQKITVSPVSGRTRLQTRKSQPVSYSAQSPEDKSRVDNSSSEREGRTREAGKQPEPRTVSQTSDYASVSSLVDFDISKEERGATVDEQIVNTAAINFLQSLFMHGELGKAYWSAQRKGFCLVNASKDQTAFKAITDGHLKVEGGDSLRSAAILEVKGRRRPRDGDHKIEMQETAQMALWIYEEPASYWTPKDDDSKC